MLLSDTRIRQAKPKAKPYKLIDGDGLVLIVNPKGSKLWRRRLRVNGTETMFAIGRYPEVGLQEARERAREAFALARRGINPAIHRRAANARAATDQASTFKTLAVAWVEGNDKWTADTRRQRRRLLERYVYPKIGDLPASEITSAMIKPILDAIHRVAPAQTAFARQCISGVMGDAIIAGLTDTDPTYVLRAKHKAPETEHARPLTVKELKPFFDALADSPMMEQTRVAVQLAFWSLGRSREVIGAKWSEFDLVGANWTIPAERMKKRRTHVVPLPTQAIAALRRLKDFMPEREVLFPNARNPRRPASHTYLNKAVTRVGPAGFSAHGIRSTGSTMLHDMKYRPEIIERQLAHVERNKTKRSYNAALYLEERREMMQDWADYLDAVKAGAKVTPIKRAAA